MITYVSLVTTNACRIDIKRMRLHTMENMPILIDLVGSESNENACQPCNDDCYESVFDEAPTCINADAQGHGCNFVQTDSLIDMHVRQDGHVTAKQLGA